MSLKETVIRRSLSEARYPSYVGIRVEKDGVVYGEFPSPRFTYRRNGYRRRYFETRYGDLCIMDVHRENHMSLNAAVLVARNMWQVTRLVEFTDEETFIDEYGKG